MENFIIYLPIPGSILYIYIQYMNLWLELSNLPLYLRGQLLFNIKFSTQSFPSTKPVIYSFDCDANKIFNIYPSDTYWDSMRSDKDRHYFCYVCDVTLSVYPYRESLKNMPGHGGNRTYDLWNTSPIMLCQLSYIFLLLLIKYYYNSNTASIIIAKLFSL